MARFAFGGQDFYIVDKTALYWPAQRALLVADLHFEKGSWFAERGQMLPPWDSLATLDRLERAAKICGARAIWALGDNFHDSTGLERMAPPVRERLDAFCARFAIHWIIGNHDETLPETLGGTIHGEAALGGVVLRHKAELLPGPPELSGHWHPKIGIATRTRRVTRPCFVVGEHRLILPAFGAFTGGMDARDPAIRSLVGNRAQALIESSGRLLAFPL